MVTGAVVISPVPNEPSACGTLYSTVNPIILSFHSHTIWNSQSVLVTIVFGVTSVGSHTGLFGSLISNDS
jgi:hypothetical protein